MHKITLLLLITFNTFANLDYFLVGNFRSYPIGSALTGEVGYGKKVYEKNKILYGYVRPAINLQTSALINQASAQVDFFPVSFFGFYAGKTIGAKSTKKLQGFDCDTIKCDGGVSKSYIGTSLALAYKGVKFVSNYRRTTMDLDNHQGYFGEEFSNLIGLDKDRLSAYTGVLGYDLNPENFLAALYINNKMKNTGQTSQMKMMLYQYKPKNIAYQAAMGIFENRHGSELFSVLLMFKWDLEKGVRLF
ncbi:hypothetical protein [Bacteriovorax sp. Seq25_V]|uniref:hypothetical protein n=1 Tax=Bacteriovorax sp. Seq25_V TaxID=1201288 RepID=UPI00038A1CC5|nr:hypothetical protein [Bacteriovorax sp. Seq25_V]EQC43598.1 hypothetical protein M900_2722 [Bacteriovorax sp. Seq25_V]